MTDSGNCAVLAACRARIQCIDQGWRTAGVLKKKYSEILLVEDEPVYQRVIVEAIERFNPDWVVRICSNGSDALHELSNTTAAFALIIVDLGLPDICGLNVVREARAARPQTPVMVASIFSDETHVLTAISAGACGYLLKDDNALELSAAVERVIAGEYPISPLLARHLFKLARPVAALPAPPDEAEFKLAPKELELLALLAKGHSYKRAALQMGVTLSTVQTYVRRLYQKLETHSKVETIARARKLGLLV